jgi:hypothetical protein
MYFSLELGPKKTLFRHSSCMFGIPHGAIKSGTINDPELKRLIDGVHGLKDGPYFVYDYRDKEVTADYLDQRIQQLTFERGKPDLVVVDYIGIMKGTKTRPNAPNYERVGDATEEVVQVAKRRGVPIITAAQFNRTGMSEKRNAKAKNKAFEYAQDMIAGDSRLVHYASMVIGVDPDTQERTNAYFPIKMRDGSFVPFITQYYPATFQIMDVSDDDQENWRAFNGIRSEAPVAGALQAEKGGLMDTESTKVTHEDGMVVVSYPGGQKAFDPQKDNVVSASEWDFEDGL